MIRIALNINAFIRCLYGGFGLDQTTFYNFNRVRQPEIHAAESTPLLESGNLVQIGTRTKRIPTLDMNFRKDQILLPSEPTKLIPKWSI